MKSQKYSTPYDVTQYLQKRNFIPLIFIALRNYSIQLEKGLPRKFLVDEKKIKEEMNQKVYTSDELNHAYNEQGHVSK
jgi:hypothetical protein